MIEQIKEDDADVDPMFSCFDKVFLEGGSQKTWSMQSFVLFQNILGLYYPFLLRFYLTLVKTCYLKTKTSNLYPSFLDPKFTWLGHLLNIVCLHLSPKEFLTILKGSRKILPSGFFPLRGSKRAKNFVFPLSCILRLP